MGLEAPLGLGIWGGAGSVEEGRQSEVVRSERLPGAGLCKQCCCTKCYGSC